MFSSASDKTQRGIEQSAALLSGAHSPLIVTGALDLAAAAAAVDLARASGAVLDHMAPSGLAPQQEQGTLATVFGEAFVRSDLILACGPLPAASTDGEGWRRLFTTSSGRGGSERIVAFGEAAASALPNAAGRIQLQLSSLAEEIGVLTALSQGRPVAMGEPTRTTAEQLVSRLKEAKYGVLVFAPEALDDMSQHALMTLANVLSAETRISLLPLSRPQGQSELLRMSQALTGLPAPIRFAGGRASHDPILFGARGVVERGDADVVVWVSCAEEAPPDWLNGQRLIVVSGRTASPKTATAHLTAAHTARDLGGLMENTATGMINWKSADARAAASSPARSAAQILRDLIEHLPERNAGAAA